MSTNLTLTINGEPQQCASANLSQVLQALDYCEDRVAVAVNEDFVPRSQYADFQLSEGDRLDIVAPVQGG